MQIIQRYEGPAIRRLEDNYSIKFLDPFLEDLGKILQSQALRRLSQKTQVFPLPDDPHIRTRRVHTDEVFVAAASIAERLGLNIHLCMAIAAGHDLGHTPYGHDGERLLSKLGGKEFRHEVFSVIVAQNFEMLGEGLNLTGVVLEGMLNHSRGYGELTANPDAVQEHTVVMLADKIVYAASDLNDAPTYGLIESEKDLPSFVHALGGHRVERVNTCIDAIVEESREKAYVCFQESKTAENFNKLREYLREEVYKKVDMFFQDEALRRLHAFFAQYLPTQEGYEDLSPVIAAALLTDKEADRCIKICRSSRKLSFNNVKRFALFKDILPYVKGRKIDYTDPDLGWYKERK